jgi:hypothetical protein
MWTQITSTTPIRRDGRRCRLLAALAWTMIVSSVAAEATWGWAMNRPDRGWVPEVVRVVLERDANPPKNQPRSTILESTRP